jgi:hypothetical protein
MEEVSGQLQTLNALPQGQSPQSPLKRRLDGPRYSLENLERRKISCSKVSKGSFILKQPHCYFTVFVR